MNLISQHGEKNGRPVTTCHEQVSIGTFFPAALVSLRHILVHLALFQAFYYYFCEGNLQSVISDVTIAAVLGHEEPHPYEAVNLMHECVCPDFSSNRLFSHLSPSPQASLFPETKILKLGHY